ncbi:MAG: prepilin-type N-terminal cleavage/methylation domain-containing protein [Patescibacteria group bacterium]
MKHETLKKEAGFTLLELVVVLALFVMILDISVSIFISIVKHQRRIFQEQEFLNQASYIEEYISKALRTSLKDPTGTCIRDGVTAYPGYIYLLTRFTGANYNGIIFLSDSNVCQEFFLDETDGLLKERKNAWTASETTQEILSSKFTIENIRFIINGNSILNGASDQDARQPRVTLLMKIKMELDDFFKEKVIQTTVSNRNLNL